MITESTIYWITRLDGLKDAVVSFGVVFAIIFAILTIIASVARFDEKNKKATKYFIISMMCTLLFILLAFTRPFIPTTKEMCAIKAIPMIVSDESVRELPEKMLRLTNEYFEDLLLDTVKVEENNNGS